MDVSENSGTPKSSILIGFSIINHPFWGTSILKHPYLLLMNQISFFTSWLMIFVHPSWQLTWILSMGHPWMKWNACFIVWAISSFHGIWHEKYVSYGKFQLSLDLVTCIHPLEVKHYPPRFTKFELRPTRVSPTASTCVGSHGSPWRLLVVALWHWR